MTHKGYSATSIELDENTMSIAGRVALERGVATFEGRTVAEAIQAFRDSVEDYLALCDEHGIEPESPTSLPSLANETGSSELSTKSVS